MDTSEMRGLLKGAQRFSKQDVSSVEYLHMALKAM